jgi:protein gp37
MNKTSIEWTDYTWNPVTGCNKISQGCKFCYAETMATRFWGDRKFIDVQMHIDKLQEPIKMESKLDGKKVFVCDVSDLFHEKVTFEFIASIFSVIAAKPLTTFQILTKRPDKALEFYQWATKNVDKVKAELSKTIPFLDLTFPPKNIWIGTSVENQEQADIRIPLLLQIPAAVRFLSCEPLIGEVDIKKWLNYIFVNEFGSHNLRWVIAGGESGHGARPMHPYWVQSLRDQCAAANVPFFFKQWGEYISIREAYNANIDVTDKRPIQMGTGLFGDRNLVKLGKSKTGNELDGKQHLAFPTSTHQHI